MIINEWNALIITDFKLFITKFGLFWSVLSQNSAFFLAFYHKIRNPGDKKNSGEAVLSHGSAGVGLLGVYSMPNSFICSFQEKGKLVSSFVSESDHGALPSKMASTMGGASSVSLRKRRT